jgi:hypothetical protein
MANEEKMYQPEQQNSGMKRLIEEFRLRFRIQENINNYSEDAFREAERKFIKFSLFGQLL